MGQSLKSPKSLWRPIYTKVIKRRCNFQVNSYCLVRRADLDLGRLYCLSISVHVKQCRIWKEGYHLLGRIVADKWLMKSQWAGKGTLDLFNLIMHKKVTFRGLLAWLVITPPAMLIGCYIV